MEHWSDFWQRSKALNCFADGQMAGQYNQAVTEFWELHFASISAHATVVDIGTGNGAIALLASSWSDSQHLNWQVYGTDAAAIDPLSTVASDKKTQRLLSSIIFKADTRVEALPFADNSVDLITSQFAFEYADRHRAVEELSRVLKPGGQIAILFHHEHSAVVNDARAEVEVLEALFEQHNFFEKAAELASVIEQYGCNMQLLQQSLKALQVQQQFNDTVNTLLNRFSGNYQGVVCKAIIEDIVQIVTKAARMREKVSLHVGNRSLDYRHQLMRQTDLMKAALNDEAVSTLRIMFERAGVNVNTSSMLLDEQLFSGVITGKKAH